MNKVHHVSMADSYGWAITDCGMDGYRDRADEFDTAKGHRFEALEQWKGVTCKNCKRNEPLTISSNAG